jgi:D-tyrosyl-tRNA(Tyr) deacylase
MELRPDDARRGPLALVAERDRSDDRVEAAGVDVVGEFGVVEAAGGSDRLLQHLKPRVRERRQKPA